ncbi:MAG: YcaO-like family protein [Bradyrhizobium sp.]|uniref:YcaO-like family protein n=1 Tax=Bradyrhizobium sp. TaxID=376 RepID=UPI001E0C58BB|nr:YcaO-like family protein [Bradyrhizobium sp.]MBV9562113.1 YcaO-like family protein [Bradyrhizobium sp.]
MSNLFANAASLLLGGATEAADDAVTDLLQALGYAQFVKIAAAEAENSDRLHCARLLQAASRFVRVFELAAPDAPGLVAFGAEIDPALAGTLHEGAPPVGVSGVGLTAQEAFQGCVGEGIEYLSQLQSGEDVLSQPEQGDPMPATDPQALELVQGLAPFRIDPDTALSWYTTTRLSDGVRILMPADLCLRRPQAQRQFAAAFPLSTGSAAGRSWEAAALHGLLELIERDAAALWWRGGLRGRAIPEAEESASRALLAVLRSDVAAPRRTWLLDITTDIGVPAVTALSCRSDGFGLAFGFAAKLTLAAAIRSAILEMCQIELALVVTEAKRAERGEMALNATDRTHLRRATSIDVDRCELLHPSASEPINHAAIDEADPRVALPRLVQLLASCGIEAYGLDLTRMRFAVPVARIIAPRVQLYPSSISTGRLSEMMGRTGGGNAYTGGIPLI